MGIFLSYRRADSELVVGPIYDRLTSRFSCDRVFRDLDSLPMGKPFQQAVEAAIANSSVALVIIGPTWVSITDSQGRRRLDDPTDFVRLEVEKALGAGFPVVPVLVNRAIMPKAEDLPESLRPLVSLHGLQVRPDPDFHRDMDRLISKVSPFLDIKEMSNLTPHGHATHSALPLTLPNEPYFALPTHEDSVACALAALRDTTSRHIISIDGIGGIGKTAIGMEAARRSLRDGLFVRAIGDCARLRALTRDGMVTVRDARLSFDELRRTVATQLGATPNDVNEILRTNPYLVLVDNLETATDVNEVANGLRPWLGVTRAIVTTRHRLADCFSIHLTELPESDSLVFLDSEAHSTNCLEIINCSTKRLREIHQTTGGSPLAMKLCVGQAQFLPISEVLQHLSRAEGDIYLFIFLADWNLLSALEQKLLILIGTAIQPMSFRQLQMLDIGKERELDRGITKLVKLSLVHTNGKEKPTQRRYYVHQLTKHFLINDLPTLWGDEGRL